MWDSLFEGIFFLLFKGNDTYLRVLIPLQTTPSPYTLHPTPYTLAHLSYTLSLSLSLSLQDSLHDIFSFSKKHKTPDFHHKFVSFAPSFFFLKKIRAKIVHVTPLTAGGRMRKDFSKESHESSVTSKERDESSVA